ncbi:MAG: hypothetical protein HC908_14245 [Calothrix sp. SM1_7_51]|nr:hypothetical protein [Calothrix sp. SM1_7_51]
MIAPSAAFAGDTAVSEQYMNQNAVVYGRNNTVVQNGQQRNIQNQRRSNSGSLFCRSRRGGSQTTASVQNMNQGAFVAGEYNTVVQQGRQDSLQSQVDAGRSYYCR